MQFILIFAFNVIFFGAYGLDSGLRVSLEYIKILYIDDEYIVGHVVAVPVSNRTKKLRASCLLKYEPTNNLEIAVTAYKLLKNKEYLFTKIKRRVESVMLAIAVMPAMDEVNKHLSPKLSWPLKPNVTYVLRDWWLPNSQVPTDLPIPIPTGRFKGIGTLIYPNNTKLVTAEAVVNIIHSYENFD